MVYKNMKNAKKHSADLTTYEYKFGITELPPNLEVNKSDILSVYLMLHQRYKLKTWKRVIETRSNFFSKIYFKLFVSNLEGMFW